MTPVLTVSLVFAARRVEGVLYRLQQCLDKRVLQLESLMGDKRQQMQIAILRRAPGDLKDFGFDD